MTAVAPVVAQCGGIWIGWSGVYLDDHGVDTLEIPESDPTDRNPTAGIKSKQVKSIAALCTKNATETNKIEFCVLNMHANNTKLK